MRGWSRAVLGFAVVAGCLAGEPASARVYVDGGIVTGVVRSAVTGEPLAGEPVRVDIGGSLDPHDLVTDEHGVFQVKLSSSTHYRVEIGGVPDGPASTVQAASGLAAVAEFATTTCDVRGARLEDTDHVSRVSCGPPIGVVERFWSPHFHDAHFFTMRFDEISHVRSADPDWIDEGRGFFAYGFTDGVCAAGTGVSRFYSPLFHSHFYTADVDESRSLRVEGSAWDQEPVWFCAQTAPGDGLVPVFRFWSPSRGTHFFTADPHEAGQVRADTRTWQAEGIAFYVPEHG